MCAYVLNTFPRILVSVSINVHNAQTGTACWVSRALFFLYSFYNYLVGKIYFTEQLYVRVIYYLLLLCA